MRFRGHFKQNLDAKNRLSIPARFRADFSPGVVLARQLDPCLGIWTPAAFEDFVASILDRLHPLSEERSDLARFFSHNSFDVELDSAGRVTIPHDLLQAAGIGREVVVGGTNRFLEVWDRERWEQDQGTLAERARAHARAGAGGGGE